MSEVAMESTQTEVSQTQVSNQPQVTGQPVQENSAVESSAQTESPNTQSSASNLMDLTDTPKESTPEVAWWFDENTPGIGEKPEWFNDTTFKTLADQAKAQPELRKKLSTFTGAPDTYEVNLDPVLEMKNEDFDREDPFFKGFQGWAKEANLNQEGYDQLVNMHLVYEQGMARDFKQTMDNFSNDQLELLSDDERSQLKTLKQWGKNNLSPELFDEFVEGADTAGMIRVLLSIKNNFMPTKIPTEMPIQKQFNRSELRELQNDPRYKSDPDYQQFVRKSYEASL